jgi:hypothetical protein
MRKKNILWLYNELPKLTAKGIINNEISEKIKDYYGKVEKKDFAQILLMVFGTIGTILIGLGIILLFGYNWDNLPRFVKTIVSFFPLIISQIICLFVLIKKEDSIVWKESSSAFLMIAIGACIALISQIYNISGDLDEFILTWMLLGFALIYLYDSNVVTLFYIIGITWWSGLAQYNDKNSILFWLLFVAMLPRLYFKYKENKYSITTTYLNWILGLCLCVATGITLEKVMPGLWIIVYGSFFAVLYLIGKLVFTDPPGFIYRHFYLIGSFGIIVLSYILTYNWPWEDIGWFNMRNTNYYNLLASIADYIIAGCLFTGSIVLSVISFFKKQKGNLALGLFPVVILICYIIVTYSYDRFTYYIYSGDTAKLIVHIITNLFIIVISIGAVINGYIQRKLYLITYGTLMLSILIALRFVFVESFFENLLVRGIIFIVIGVLFLFTNLFFSKLLKKQLANEAIK